MSGSHGDGIKYLIFTSWRLCECERSLPTSLGTEPMGMGDELANFLWGTLGIYRDVYGLKRVTALAWVTLGGLCCPSISSSGCEFDHNKATTLDPWKRVQIGVSEQKLQEHKRPTQCQLCETQSSCQRPQNEGTECNELKLSCGLSDPSIFLVSSKRNPGISLDLHKPRSCQLCFVWEIIQTPFALSFISAKDLLSISFQVSISNEN